MKERKIVGINYAVDIGAVAIVIFMIYSILNSSLLYKEIVVIFIKGLAAFIALLSFKVYFYKFLSFIQFFSFQLFLFSCLFISEKKFMFLAFFYLLVGMIMVVTRCFEIKKMKILGRNLSITMVLFILSFFLAKTLIVKTPKKGEIEFFSFLSLETERFGEEERYFYLLDKLFQAVKAPSPGNSQEKTHNLFLFSQLAKEPPSFLEVLKAYLGLIDYLRREGVGLEGESESIVILREFMKSKIKKTLKKIVREIIGNSKDLPLKKKIELFKSTIIMLNSRSVEKIERAKKHIKETMEESKKTRKVTELSDELERWRILEIYLGKIEELEKMFKEEKDSFEEKVLSFVKDIEKRKSGEEVEGIRNELEILEGYRNFGEGRKIIEKVKDLTKIYSRLVKENKLEGDEKQKEARLISLQVFPSLVEIMKGKKRRLKAVAAFSTYSKDVTSSVDWISSNNDVARIKDGWVRAISEGETTVYAYFLGKKSNFCKIKVVSPIIKYLVLSVDKSKIKMGDSAKLKAKAYYSDFVFKDVTSEVKFYISNSKVIRGKENIIEGVRWGRASIYCEYKGIKSPTIEIKVLPSLMYLIKIIILILLIFFIFSFLYFFFCQKIKYYQLKRKMQFSPRDFIIELYDNLRKILGFFGFAYANQPLLEYVTFIEEKTGIKNVFLKITNKFMEANYSNREIKLEEVVIFVKYYNNFLKGFIKKHNLITFLKKYCLVFFRKYIFFF